MNTAQTNRAIATDTEHPSGDTDKPLHTGRLLARVRAEYLEMPGLWLTLDQAHRLCGIERLTCRALFNALVEEKFLSVKPGGAYARASES